jgi:hypothetical protein
MGSRREAVRITWKVQHQTDRKRWAERNWGKKLRETRSCNNYLKKITENRLSDTILHGVGWSVMGASITSYNLSTECSFFEINFLKPVPCRERQRSTHKEWCKLEERGLRKSRTELCSPCCDICYPRELFIDAPHWGLQSLYSLSSDQSWPSRWQRPVISSLSEDNTSGIPTSSSYPQLVKW